MQCTPRGEAQPGGTLVPTIQKFKNSINSTWYHGPRASSSAATAIKHLMLLRFTTHAEAISSRTQNPSRAPHYLEVSVRRTRHGTRGLDIAQLREGRFEVSVSLALDLALVWPVTLRGPLSVAAVQAVGNVHAFHNLGERASYQCDGRSGGGHKTMFRDCGQRKSVGSRWS